MPPSHANSTGLLLLDRLLATAPPLDSTFLFLPEQRTVFLVRALQRWFTDEEGDNEDLNEDVQARLVQLFSYLTPILQNVPGSHWDFVFDLIEENVEVSCQQIFK